jgi:hypothetical protein
VSFLLNPACERVLPEPALKHPNMVGFPLRPGPVMATAPILHVGDDLCYRIPVMERAGISVYRTQCSAEGVRNAFGSNGTFSVLAFQMDAAPIPDPVLTVARSFSSPLILFENPGITIDPDVFDLVIPNQTRPETWLRFLRLAIEESRKLHAYSRQLRENTATVRSDFRDLRAQVRRNLVSPVDLDRIWRGESESFRPGLQRRPEKKD